LRGFSQAVAGNGGALACSNYLSPFKRRFLPFLVLAAMRQPPQMGFQGKVIKTLRPPGVKTKKPPLGGFFIVLKP